MRISIIGANGQLGSDLVKAFRNEEVEAFTHSDLDVGNFDSLIKLKESKPEFIINTAAFHKTDDCEDNPEKTFSVNAIGARNVARVCNELGATMVCISTDYVFDGLKNVPYNENDTPNPINTYGISKVAGESYTKLADKHYIFRVASLFGAAGASGKGGNFVETMIKKARNIEEIKVVDDMIMSPTYTRDAADMIRNVILKKLPFGTYHIANSGECSWYDFAEAIFETLGMKANLSPTKTDILKTKARRPMFSPIMSIKLNKYGFEMESWRAALKNYLIEKEHLK